MLNSRFLFENISLVQILINKNISLSNESKMRIRNKPIYLKDYITKLDLRTIPVVISHIPISRQVNEEQKSDFGELYGYLIHLIRLRMDHTVSRYFSITIGIVSNSYLQFLFGKCNNRKRTRKINIRINGTKYKVNSVTWKFLVASDFITHDGHLKIYKNQYKEFYKIELVWLRFKFNDCTKILSCSGKFSAFIKNENQWKLV